MCPFGGTDPQDRGRINPNRKGYPSYSATLSGKPWPDLLSEVCLLDLVPYFAQTLTPLHPYTIPTNH